MKGGDSSLDGSSERNEKASSAEAVAANISRGIDLLEVTGYANRRAGWLPIAQQSGCPAQESETSEREGHSGLAAADRGQQALPIWVTE